MKVDAALKSKGCSLKLGDIMNVEKSASGTCYEAFKNLQTKSQQEKYFKETVGVTEVKRIPLGRIFIRGRKGSHHENKSHRTEDDVRAHRRNS